MKNISRRNIGGFTLVEILVVVLIIGILSAVAVPMYQGAVDKSRFSTLLPAAKSIKDAEEAMRMSTGLYTDKMEDLDISMENGELNFTFDIHNSLADPSLFRTTSPKLENVRLASYFDFNPMMAGQKHCEAKAGDERANRLCGPLLQGQEFGTTTDGYIRYLLDKDIDKPTCDDANRSWSSSQSKCYKDDATRCDALGGMGVLSAGQCGYENQGGTKNDPLIIGAEGICQTDTPHNSGFGAKCGNAIVESGGLCISKGGDGCNSITVEKGGRCEVVSGYSTNCSYSTIKGEVICTGGNQHCGYGNTFDGGVCVGNKTTHAWGACVNSTFKNGATCYANTAGSCGYYNGTTENRYDDTSCCCGAYCPDYAPKCAASRCDPQYMK